MSTESANEQHNNDDGVDKMARMVSLTRKLLAVPKEELDRLRDADKRGRPRGAKP
jgi:hypothetical protein